MSSLLIALIVSVLHNRAYLVMWIEIAVVLPLICLFEPIFLLLQVEAEVAHIAAKYMQYTAFGVPVSSLIIIIDCSACMTWLLMARFRASSRTNVCENTVKLRGGWLDQRRR